jgi:hypothetical protein
VSRLLAAQRALTVPGWVKDELWRRARATPSLDLRFADSKSLVDATTGQNLVTFTRASSGTYVDSQGVIRNAVTNLLLRSAEINEAAWFKFNTTVSPNVATSPDGSQTADNVIPNAVTGLFYVSQTITTVVSTVYTFSFYAKANGFSWVFADAFNGTNRRTWFNLANGTLGTVAAGTTAAISAAGNGWYRCSISLAAGAASIPYAIAVTSANNVFTGVTGNGVDGVLVWGAQLEQSSTVGEYIPTGATINSAPRFDHNPTTGESLGLLIEEQRTNSIRNNTMVGAVAGTPGTLPTNWVLGSLNGLAISVIGTGTEAGVTYIDIRFNGTTTAASQTSINFDALTATVATNLQAWTQSFYCRVVDGSTANLSVLSFVISRTAASGNNGQNVVDITGSLGHTSLPLVRHTNSYTMPAASTAFVSSDIRVGYSNGAAIDITLRIGMPQLEQGAFATSVIPTTGTAATRSADVASISGSNFSSWYRQDEGTLLCRASSYGLSTSSRFMASMNDGSANNIHELLLVSGNAVQFLEKSANTFTAALTSGSVTPAQALNAAGAYRRNDFALSVSGESVLTDLSGDVATGVNRIDVGTRLSTLPLNGHLSRLTFWPQRLGNEVLQRITQ